ncbi:MAG: aminodeoxychorismate synthase component I [Actinomycetota bacterium]
MTAPLPHRLLRRAIVRDPHGHPDRWLSFRRPRRSVSVWEFDEVLGAIDDAERAALDGAWVVAMVSYDAGPACDDAIVARRDPTVPLMAYAVFDRPDHGHAFDGVDRGDESGADEPTFLATGWSPEIDRRRYEEAFRRVKDHIALGQTYQVNLTLRLRAAFAGDPEGLFRAMNRLEQARHGAFLDLGDAAVCSASPELFFHRRGDVLTSRPMKGTRPRSLDPDRDEALAKELAASEKDRAENTMIVDMTRNDLARVADLGTVAVPRLHQLEPYRTVHQLTSTVTARSTAPLSRIFAATFPGASITGAPKVRTCELITEIESSPRGIYTGTIGVIAPGGDSEWNIAIRTAWIDRARDQAVYGVGGGIVWDSTVDDEWTEAQHKSRVLLRSSRPFLLLETSVWEPDTGVRLARRHLDRMARSALAFGFDFDRAEAEQTMATIEADEPRLVRLLLHADGRIDRELHPLPDPVPEPWDVPLDDAPVDRFDEFLHHKTTRRDRYEAARRRHPDAPDVILWNDDRMLTETTIGNLVVHLDGVAWTPPRSAGLLAGTMRAELLDRGEITERPLHVNDLLRAERVEMINSVRGRVALQPRR